MKTEHVEGMLCLQDIWKPKVIETTVTFSDFGQNFQFWYFYHKNNIKTTLFKATISSSCNDKTKKYIIHLILLVTEANIADAT